MPSDPVDGARARMLDAAEVVNALRDQAVIARSDPTREQGTLDAWRLAVLELNARCSDWVAATKGADP